MKRIITGFIFLLLCFSAKAQDSSGLRVSLLTCTPGNELYSTFGHSAMRVVDANAGTDRVYNYGTFDFDEPGFYMKFVRGQLRYFVSVTDYTGFAWDYSAGGRGITEQVLDISPNEKRELYAALQENIKEENRFYLYDFFLDNCTTRLRDLIIRSSKPAPVLPPVMPVLFTFRNAIHQYLDNNNKSWSKLGIDLLLGAPTDAVMTTAQQQFLPDNLMYALDSAAKVKIVANKQQLSEISGTRNSREWFTPLAMFSLLLILWLTLSLLRGDAVKQVLRRMDAFLFFCVGLLGILFVLMWTATDHSMTKNNYNLMWAWPVHVIYAVYMNRETKRVRSFSMLISIFLVLLLCCWFFLPQQLNSALLPLIVLMIWRTAVRGSRKKKKMLL